MYEKYSNNNNSGDFYSAHLPHKVRVQGTLHYVYILFYAYILYYVYILFYAYILLIM